MDIDEDLERRLDHASALVRFMLPFSLAWVLLSFIFDAQVSASGALVASMGLMAAILLENRLDPLWLRCFWLLVLDMGMTVAVMAVHPASYAVFIVVFRATMPLMIFSPKEPAWLRWGLVVPPILFWFLAWWVDYRFLPEFDISEEIARSYFAPLTGITLFGVLLFEFSYFDRLSVRNVSELRAAREVSEIAHDAKSRFLRSLTHDMRTPLHTITGYCDMTRVEAGEEGKLHPKLVHDRMTNVLSASQELLGMIDKGISLAALSGRGMEVSAKDFALKPVLEMVVSELEPMAQERGISLQIGDNMTAFLYADPDFTVSSLRHLLENSLKFCSEGNVVEVVCEPVGDKEYEISVIDDGPGFPPGAEEAAFAPFERLGQTMGSTFGGGVGLSLTKAQVEAMGGSIGIDPERYLGARVWIRLPRSKGS